MKRGTPGKSHWRRPFGLFCAACLLVAAPVGGASFANEPDRSAKSAEQASAASATSLLRTVELTVGSGDTLFSLLGRTGVRKSGRMAVLDALKGRFDPRTLRPHDKVRLVLQSHKDDVVVHSLDLDLRGRDNVALNMSEAGTRRRPHNRIVFIFPLQKPEISSPFGWRTHPVFGDRRFHKGIDIRAPKGTPVSVSADGVVAEVGRRGNYGKYIRVRHTATVETTYSHLSGYASGLHAGQRVRQGQVIGYVGRTGVATGNHLYYEMLINGRHVDPLHPPSVIPDQELSSLKAPDRTDHLN